MSLSDSSNIAMMESATLATGSKGVGCSNGLGMGVILGRT